MPPQHGKSHGASVLLPAWLLGCDPDRRIAIASYSSSLASRFNRRVQRLIDSPEYAAIFPATTIKKSGTSKSTDTAPAAAAGQTSPAASRLECRVTLTASVYRRTEILPEGRRRPISDVVPVWGEFSTTGPEGPVPNEFSFQDLTPFLIDYDSTKYRHPPASPRPASEGRFLLRGEAPGV
jgi:hypothetical protein